MRECYIYYIQKKYKLFALAQGPSPLGRGKCCIHFSLWGGPLWARWALVGLALVGPLGFCGPRPCALPCWPGPCGPPGHLWAGLLWAPWALIGRALMGTLVNQTLGSMANPLNFFAHLKWHKATYIYIYIYIYIYTWQRLINPSQGK